MNAFPIRHTATVDEYLTLNQAHTDELYEYIDGYIKMLPTEAPIHTQLRELFQAILQPLLQEHTLLTSRSCIQLSERRYVYPDIAIISNNNTSEEAANKPQQPRVIFEILAPQTENYDRSDKFSYYRNCSTIQEYVLISSTDACIDLFRHERNLLWSFHRFELADELVLTSLGIRMPIRSIYQHITFTATKQ